MHIYSVDFQKTDEECKTLTCDIRVYKNVEIMLNGKKEI